MLGHNYSRSIATVRRGGCRRSSGRATTTCRRSASRPRCRRRQARRSRARRRRRSASATARFRSCPTRVQDTAAAGHARAATDDADQLSGAARCSSNGERPYPIVRSSRHLFASESQLLERGEADGRSGGVQGQDRIHRADRVRSGRRLHRRRSATTRHMPGIQLHATWRTAFCRTGSSGRRRPRRGSRRRSSAACWSACWPRLLPFTPPPPAHCWRFGGWTWFARQRVQGRAVAEHGAAAGRDGAIALFAGTAYQYFVEGREKRMVKRLFGRYVSRDVYSS